MSLRIDIIRNGGAPETVVAKGTVALGRSDDETVALPGMAIARHHAEIAIDSEHALRLRCRSPLGVEVNGTIVKDEKVLHAGDRFRIGPHVGEVTTDLETNALMLRLRLDAEPSKGAFAERRLDLRAAGMRIRQPAYIGAALVLLLALAIPLLLRAVNVPPVVETVLPTDDWWSSGVVSNGHQHFAGDCAVCHERLFVRVQDTACLDCHQGIAHHSDRPQEAGLGVVEEQRCASCHREHGSTHAILPDHPKTCVNCHADPTAFPDSVDMHAVHDFDGHPGFRATVSRMEEGEQTLHRVALQASPSDDAGLIFPHDVHLDDEGVLGPDGVEQLACADCHQPDAGNVGFRAIRFESDCQSCHQLDAAVGDEVLDLPHAKPDAVRRQVTAAVEAMPKEAFSADLEQLGRRRAGPMAERGGAPTADELVAEVFSTRVCAKCHAVRKDAQDQVDVLPARLRQSWLIHARFTHADHGWVDCESCHEAPSSSEATDLLLPDIATCRTCHSGVASNEGVGSTCTDCHGFHTAEHSVLGSVQGDVHNGEASAKAR